MSEQTRLLGDAARPAFVESVEPVEPVEFDRYELREPLPYHFEVERREFLQLLAAMGGGLLVLAGVPAGAQESGRTARGRAPSTDLASWIHIDERGHVTAYTGKVEIGQNMRTSLTAVVADELRVPVAAVTIVYGDTDRVPFDMGTFGSQTTPRMVPIIARAAATARQMLLDAAAAAWKVDRATLRADNGTVRATDGRTIGYGELVTQKPLAGAVADALEAMPAPAWRVRGTAVPKVDGRAFVTGRHAFTPDMVRPGMLHGRVIRPDAHGRTIGTVDDSRARAMHGVTVVRDGELLGVVAPSTRAVAAAASAIRVEWQGTTPAVSSDTVFDHLKKTAAPQGAPFTAGNVATGHAAATRTFEATYRIPYIAHTPLEPRAALAEWQDGKLTVWTGTQRPFGVRTELAEAFRLPEAQVRVIVADTGSAYGGKHTGEAAIEAARLAKAAGRPVKVVWTRVEEFTWAYFRPAGVIDVKAGVDADGRLTFWEFDNVNSGTSGIRTPYDVPHQRIAFHAADSPLRQGSYRGLAATANHYAREMHMDAVARALGTDAVAFRLQHLSEARLKAVLTACAEKAGWPRAARPGRALGIACGTEKGGFVATAAEVSKAPGGLRVERIVVVFECGAIINPDGLRNQVEGAVVQGLGGALFEAVTFADGQVLNGSMEQYRVPRFRDVPPIEVVLLDRKDLKSEGAGETPIVCVAPAIGAAARAFGEVLTALPITLKT